MTGLTLLVAAAAASMVLARAFRAPPIPFLLLGGVALSAIARPPAELLDSALILGVSFLIFALGLELDLGRIRVQRRAALRVGLAQFVALAALGWGGARLLGFDGGEAAFVALALPASSTLVAVRILQRRRQMYEPFGRLVLGVLLLQDLLVVLLVPVVLNAGGGAGTVLPGMGGVLLLGILAWGTRTHVAPLLVRISEEREAVLLGSLAVLFIFLGAAALLRLPGVVGAFLAGVALASFPVNGIIRGELAPLRDFFAAVFFVALGALVRIPTGLELAQAAALAAGVVLVTPPLVALVAERSGFSSRSALEAGLLLSQTSEISLVIGLVGLMQGSIGEELFVVLSLVALSTMVLTPIISTDRATRLLLALFRRRAPVVGARAPSGHVLILGAGSSGMPLVEDLILSGRAVSVVDDDPAVVADLRAAGIHAVRGEISDPAALERAGLGSARAVCSTARRVRDNDAVLRTAPGIPVLVRVFEEEDEAWVRARGGEPLLYTRAAADELLEWFAADEDGGVARTDGAA